MECKIAENIISECNVKKNESRHSADYGKNKVDHELSLKLRQIDFVRSEIILQKDIMCAEMDLLLPFQNQLQKSIDALKYPEQILQKCREIRKGRINEDLCNDYVEKELTSEIESITEALKKFLELSNILKEQLRKFRALLYAVTLNLEGKDEALMIERQNSGLRLSDFGSDIRTKDPVFISKYNFTDWEDDACKIIESMKTESYNGAALRSRIESTLKNETEILLLRYNATNNAFEKRIVEYKVAKEKFELENNRFNHQINKMKENIEELQNSIADKKPYMAVAIDRLKNRNNRTGIELCRDDVEKELINEIIGLQTIDTDLMEQLAICQMSLSSLQQAQDKIEYQIRIKLNSIKIDEVECMTLRRSIHHHVQG